MYGPLFQISDELVWKDEPAPGHEEAGPFKVATVENNNDPDACVCGASRKNGYIHYDDVEEGDCCGELPAQWVTITCNGIIVKNRDGSDAVFCSDWFRKA
ncbi:MAG: hypothetical protein PHO91_01630 [Patescibacteria group bacterium]|nr:hypothetical protein [Patescibacteria group bacterium]